MLLMPMATIPIRNPLDLPDGDLPFEGAAERARHAAAHGYPVFHDHRDQGLKLFQGLLNGAVAIGAVMGFADRHHQVDLVGFERKRPLDPLEVRRQESIGNARKPVDLRHHLLGVGQLRNRLGMDDGGYLDIL